jgi:hypothetical protein
VALLNPGVLLKRDKVHVWQLLSVLMELFSSIDLHKRVRVTLPDSILEIMKE